MDNFEELLFKRFDKLEEKLDEVRTTTLPAIKTEVALIAERDRFHNKVFSGAGSIIAILTSAFLSHGKR